MNCKYQTCFKDIFMLASSSFIKYHLQPVSYFPSLCVKQMNIKYYVFPYSISEWLPISQPSNSGYLRAAEFQTRLILNWLNRGSYLMFKAHLPSPFARSTIITLSLIGKELQTSLLNPDSLQPCRCHYGTEMHMKDAHQIGTKTFCKRTTKKQMLDKCGKRLKLSIIKP